MPDFSSHSLWNANEDNPIAHALKHRSNISLRCCLPHGNACKDLALEGLLRSLDGRDGFLTVKASMPISDKTQREADTECAFSFSMERKQDDGANARFGVSGQAMILQTKLNANKTLESLLLRFPRNCTVRRLRMNKRYIWKPDYCRLLRIMMPSQIPDTRDDLATLLRQYAMSSEGEQEICDISAGGACVVLGTDLSHYTFGADKVYIFFFISSKTEQNEHPFVFLAQRLGYGHAKNKRTAPVRMRFLAEMDWSSQDKKIRWLDVRQEGSLLLREHLKRFKDVESTLSTKAHEK
ncbi:MAG: hypothetical protein J5803_05340 [Desulfovibrio sp.]|nr:hypothetical protein [Desulfovibrio sp.]